MQERKVGKAAVYGVLAIAWIGVLFFFSGQSGEASGALSERMTRWLFGWWIDRGADARALEHLLRKMAHAGIFAVEGFLVSGALMNLLRRRTAVTLIVLLCGALAVANELHEQLADGRVCSVYDMGIDLAGALCGLLAAAAAMRLLRFIRRRKNDKL